MSRGDTTTAATECSRTFYPEDRKPDAALKATSQTIVGVISR